MKRFLKVAAVVILAPVSALALALVLLAMFFSGGGDSCNFSPDPSQVLENAGGIKIGSEPISGEQIGISQTIVRVGAQRKESVLKVKLALMVAIQESHLMNLHYGDRTSLGVFQQQEWWGTVEQRLNVTYASNKFYDELDEVPGAEEMLRQGKFLEVALLVQHPSRAAYLNPSNYFPGWASVADLLLGIAPGENQPGSPIVSPCGGIDTGVPGRVTIQPGANAPGRPVTPETLDFLSKVSGIYGKTLICTTGTDHSYLTTSGNVSDHVGGHACDIGMVPNGGSDNSPVGDAIAAACLMAANDPSVVPKANALEAARGGGLWTLHDKEANLRIQCIWKSPDHYDHVHIGASPLSGPSQPKGGSFD